MEGVQLQPGDDFYLLYENHRESVYRAVRAIVLNHEVAQDLTQEAFEKAYKARDRFQATGSAGAWVHRIGVNLAISYWRRQKLTRLLPVRLFVREDSNSAFDRVEARTVVEKALSALSPKLRAVVVLHYYNELTREQISQVLGIPPGTVASRLQTALQIMNRTVATDQTQASKRLTKRIVNEEAASVG